MFNNICQTWHKRWNRGEGERGIYHRELVIPSRAEVQSLAAVWKIWHKGDFKPFKCQVAIKLLICTYGCEIWGPQVNQRSCLSTVHFSKALFWSASWVIEDFEAVGGLILKNSSGPTFSTLLVRILHLLKPKQKDISIFFIHVLDIIPISHYFDNCWQISKTLRDDNVNLLERWFDSVENVSEKDNCCK